MAFEYFLCLLGNDEAVSFSATVLERNLQKYQENFFKLKISTSRLSTIFYRIGHETYIFLIFNVKCFESIRTGKFRTGVVHNQL